MRFEDCGNVGSYEIILRGVAQLAERHIRDVEVTGSNPAASILYVLRRSVDDDKKSNRRGLFMRG